MIPRALRINDGDGALLADAQAADLAAQDEGRGSGEPEFLEAAFQKLPRFEAFRTAAAERLGGIRAEKDVALAGFQTLRLSESGEIGHGEWLHGWRICHAIGWDHPVVVGGFFLRRVSN